MNYEKKNILKSFKETPKIVEKSKSKKIMKSLKFPPSNLLNFC